MKTDHNGVEITYVEGTDDWHFQLRGRARKADSLAKAREAIDKEPAEKRKPFPRFEAYHDSYDGFHKVVVTSIADDSYHKGVSFWILRGADRRKEKDSSLFQINEHNDQIIQQMRAKEQAKRTLDEEIRVLRRQLQIIEAPEGL